jgi:hypothetical protein
MLSLLVAVAVSRWRRSKRGASRDVGRTCPCLAAFFLGLSPRCLRSDCTIAFVGLSLCVVTCSRRPIVRVREPKSAKPDHSRLGLSLGRIIHAPLAGLAQLGLHVDGVAERLLVLVELRLR